MKQTIEVFGLNLKEYRYGKSSGLCEYWIEFGSTTYIIIDYEK